MNTRYFKFELILHSTEVSKYLVSFFFFCRSFHPTSNKKGNFLIKGIENALQDKNIDIRIFGKPETKPYRRMGVILASTFKKAKEAWSKIRVANI